MVCKTTLTLCLLLSFSGSAAPLAEPSFSNETWHLGLSLGAGTMTDFHAEGGITSESGWAYELHFLSLWAPATNIPNDYSGGLYLYDFEADPRLVMNCGGMTIGLYSVLGKSTRGLLQAGFLVGGYQSPEHFTPVTNGGGFIFGPNYEYDVRSGTWGGLYIHPEVFVVARSVGMKMGCNIIFAMYRSSVGLEVGILLGKLKGRGQVHGR